MEKVDACIVSFYMSNINPDAVKAQRDVVQKFNPAGYPHYQIKTGMRHGHSMDAAWHLNGIAVRDEFRPQIRAQWPNHDVMLFLDIDAVPLNNTAIDRYVTEAKAGALVGNVQRSNHIQNNQHLFVAPSAMAISMESFITIRTPSAIETNRSDVGEEYTWLMEKAGQSVKFYWPLRFEGKPFAPPGHPETPHWALRDGDPVYGLQTTFGDPSTGEETFWHNFQSFYPDQHEKFMAKCESLLRA